MTTHSHFHFICQITAFKKYRLPLFHLAATDAEKKGPHQGPSCSVYTRRQHPHPPVAYPELHDHSVQRGSLGHHHSSRSQVLVHRGTDIPEVQVVPWQQARGEEGFTQEQGDLVTKTGRSQVSGVRLTSEGQLSDFTGTCTRSFTQPADESAPEDTEDYGVEDRHKQGRE